LSKKITKPERRFSRHSEKCSTRLPPNFGPGGSLLKHGSDPRNRNPIRVEYRKKVPKGRSLRNNSGPQIAGTAF
jgi:hypothetical protein